MFGNRGGGSKGIPDEEISNILHYIVDTWGPSDDTIENILNRIGDVENTRVGIVFKTQLRNTLYQLELGYQWTMVMYIVTFFLGVVLVAAGLFMAFTDQTSLFGVLFTGVGGLDILLFFFSDPPAKLEKSRNNFAMLIAPYYAWHVEMVNRHDLLNHYRAEMRGRGGVELLRKKMAHRIDKMEIDMCDPKLEKYLKDIENFWKEVVEIDKNYCQSHKEVKQIWEEIFETEKTQYQAILEDTSRFIEMMEKISPLQSTGRSTPPKTYTITVTAGVGGAITPAGPVFVNDGANLIFTITPNSGYTIHDVKVKGASQGAISSYEFKGVHEDQTIEATFDTQTQNPKPSP